MELKVLPALHGETAPASVRLVRELKMPTVDRLISDPDVAALPEAMASVEEAVAEGDLAQAEEMLDGALATMLEGPGHQRRTAGFSDVATRFLPVLLWVWCAVLLVLLLLNLVL